MAGNGDQTPQPQPRGGKIDIPNHSTDPKYQVPGNSDMTPPTRITGWFG